ncbi:MAG: hypothetical protein RR922_06770 [Clostridia bacterium]
MKKANDFITKYFDTLNFCITETRQDGECFILRAEKNDRKYAIFTYHYINERALEIDEKLLSSVYNDKWSKDAICLMVYFRAKPLDNFDEKYEYTACNSDGPVEVWKVDMVDQHPMAIYYPRQSIMDLMKRFYEDIKNKNEEDLFEIIKGSVDEDGRETFKTREIQGVKERIFDTNARIDIGFLKCNDIVYSLILILDHKDYIGLTTLERKAATDLEDDVDYIKSIDYYRAEQTDFIIIDNYYFDNMK